MEGPGQLASLSIRESRAGRGGHISRTVRLTSRLYRPTQ